MNRKQMRIEAKKSWGKTHHYQQQLSGYVCAEWYGIGKCRTIDVVNHFFYQFYWK